MAVASSLASILMGAGVAGLGGTILLKATGLSDAIKAKIDPDGGNDSSFAATLIEYTLVFCVIGGVIWFFWDEFKGAVDGAKSS